MSNKTTLTRITGNQALPLNDNMDKIEAEFNNSLSRDGSTPNQMESDLDMNSNHILNIPDPTEDNHVANKRYVDKTLSELTEILDQETLDFLVNLDEEVQDYQNSMDALLESGVGSLGTPITKWSVDHEGIVAAEADNTVEYVNLLGNTITTTLNESQITKKYFNGVLYVNNVLSNSSQYRNESPISSEEITKPWTKSPKRAWSGTSGLWVGTSIPHQLVTTQSYPNLVAQGLNATVTNNAWSGSHLTFDPDADPNLSSSVRALTMTDADLAAELAIHGAGSVYSDTHDAVTISSEMTLEHRVIEPIISSPVDWVVCDHNHNDRYVAPGTLTPPEYTISGVTKGTTTSITVTDATGLAVGDGIALKELTGIDYLQYAVGRVTSVSTNTITIELNSSSFSGTFSAGTLVKLDRSTLWGAMDFFAYAVWNATLRGGQTTLPPIMWNSAPSEYTNTSDYPGSQSIRSNSDYLYEWVISRNQTIEDNLLSVPYHTFYDQLTILDIKEKDQLVWLPDGVHPTDSDATRMFANHWLQWMLGGAARHYDESEIRLTGSAPEDIDQYPMIYSAFYDGVGRPEWSEGPAVIVKTEDFTSISDWSSNTGSAVAGSAPWGSGSALNVTVTNGNTAQFLTLLQADFADATALSPYASVEFDLYVPTTTGAVSTSVATIPILSIDTGNTAHYQIQLLARSSGMTLRGAALPSIGGAFSYTVDTDIIAATKHRVKLLSVKGDGTNFEGGLVLFLDGKMVGSPIRFDNSGRADSTQIRIGALPPVNATSTFTFSIGNLSIVDKSLSAWTKTLGEMGGTINASSVNLADLANVSDVGAQDGWALRRQSDGSYAFEADPSGSGSFGGTLTNTNLEVVNDNSLTGSLPIVSIRRLRTDYASVGLANFGQLVFTGYDNAQNEDEFVSLRVQSISNTSGAETGRLTVYTKNSGTDISQLQVQNGVVVGSGTFYGVGTLNVQNGIRINNVALKTTHLSDWSSSTPSLNQVPKWNGSQWVPSTDLTGSGGGTNNPEQSAIANPGSAITDSTNGSLSQTLVTMDATFTSAYGTSSGRINDNFASIASDLNDHRNVLLNILTALRAADIISY